MLISQLAGLLGGPLNLPSGSLSVTRTVHRHLIFSILMALRGGVWFSFFTGLKEFEIYS